MNISKQEAPPYNEMFFEIVRKLNSFYQAQLPEQLLRREDET
jgi:hypothetical protein